MGPPLATTAESDGNSLLWNAAVLSYPRADSGKCAAEKSELPTNKQKNDNRQRNADQKEQYASTHHRACLDEA